MEKGACGKSSGHKQRITMNSAAALANLERYMHMRTSLAEEDRQDILNGYQKYLGYREQGDVEDNVSYATKFVAMVELMKRMFDRVVQSYLSVHLIDLNNKNYMLIGLSEHMRTLVKEDMCLEELFDTIIAGLVKPEYQREVAEFMDVSTLAQRLGTKPMISCDFLEVHFGWCREFFLPISYNEDGSVKEVLFLTQNIQTEKEQEARLQGMLQFKLENLWGTYENLDDIVYASDMDTHELLYMNRKCRETVGLASTDDYRGRKCYEVIQGRKVPCEFCSNEKLMQGEECEYEFFNAQYQVLTHIQDRRIQYDNRNIRIEHAVEIKADASESHVGKEAHVRLAVRDSINVALDEKDAHLALQKLIDCLGDVLQAERTYIFEETDDKLAWTNSYEWCAAGVTAEKESLSYLPKKIAVTWEQAFARGSFIKIRDIEEIRESNPIVYSYLAPQNIHSLVAVPLYHGEQLYGFMGVDNPPADVVEVLGDQLNLLTHMVKTLIERRKIKDNLHYMAFVDSMTGLKNRHGLEHFFENANENESLGIAFFDVCGLKYVNDNLGHLMGDAAILRARDMVREAFAGYEIFRWGGDEMLAIGRNVQEEDFFRACDRLKENSLRQHAPLAVGGIWQDNGREHKEMLKEADRIMYIHKGKLYKEYDIVAMLREPK